MPRTRIALASSAALVLLLSACGGSSEAQEEAASASSVEVEDNFGTQTVPLPATSVVATDNRTFQILDSWGVELAAAPKRLMSEDVSYRNDESVVDLGNHREPDLEALVAAEPDLVINGQRFAQYRGEIEELAPDATILELDPRDGENFADELKRQTTALGTAFDKEDEASALVDDFDASIERVQAAYDPEQTVMTVITSGGDINFSAPGAGRTLGPVYDILGLTPALEAEGTDVDTGEDISVEAIAESEPDWIFAMDRDAATSANTGEEYTPAADILGDSEALQDVPAVESEQIVYMPQNTYLNESIITYTEFFNSIADRMEQG